MFKLFVFLLLTAWSTVTAAAGTILVYGDSLSAAYGIGEKQGWVTLLGDRLKQRGANYSVVNASISGETTAGGAARIDDALRRHKPSIVVVALGANDGLRGLPISAMKTNLVKMVRAAQAAEARVLVVGMRMPPNYGAKYANEFYQAFADVAREQKAGYVPFLLEGLAEKQEAFQSDQIHPTAEAQATLLESVWKGLEPLLKK
jgi:acyl-CoA thioesterase-1